jgi:hypothetical protein
MRSTNWSYQKLWQQLQIIGINGALGNVAKYSETIRASSDQAKM